MPITFSNLFSIAFIGILIYQCTLSAIQFSLNKRREYLLYSFYILMLIINFIVNFYFWLYKDGGTYNYLFIKQIFGVPINFFIQIAYLLFLIDYLHINNKYAKFRKHIYQQIAYNIILGVGLTIYSIYNPLWPTWLNVLAFALSFVLYIYLGYWLLVTKPNNYIFILKGTIFLLICFLINLTFTISNLNYFYNDTIIMIGIIIEIVYFNYGLQYKLQTQEKALLLAQIEKRKAIEQEQQRVSADLHDEVGSVLSSIQIMSVISKKQIEVNLDESKKLLGLIGQQALKMQHSLSEIVWGLRTDLDSVEDLSIKIQEILAYSLEPAKINFRIVLDERINKIKLSVLQRRNILLIIKESINNILKYAEANEVFIKIKEENNYLTVQIADTGKGFGPDKKYGNGLRSIEKRALLMNGTVTINSTEGKGTIVLCTIPL